MLDSLSSSSTSFSTCSHRKPPPPPPPLLFPSFLFLSLLSSTIVNHHHHRLLFLLPPPPFYKPVHSRIFPSDNNKIKLSCLSSPCGHWRNAWLLLPWLPQDQKALLVLNDPSIFHDYWMSHQNMNKINQILRRTNSS